MFVGYLLAQLVLVAFAIVVLRSSATGGTDPMNAIGVILCLTMLQDLVADFASIRIVSLEDDDDEDDLTTA